MSLLEAPASFPAVPSSTGTRELVLSGESTVQGKALRTPDPLRWGQKILLSALLMALFCEWLYPVRRLMEEEAGRWFPLFVGLTGLLLIAGCLPVYKSVYGLLTVSLVGGSFYYLYGNGAGAAWLQKYGTLLVTDLEELARTGRLYGVSGESRTLLLLIGWVLLVASVQMLALGRHSILLFFSASVLYLLVLELVLDTSFLPGMIRTIVWGLLLQGLIAGYLQRPAGMIRGKGLGIVAAMLCVLAAWSTVQLLPAQPVRDISWDRIAQTVERWSKSYSGMNRAASTDSVSGYGRDDSRLGAPLELRKEVYFTAVSSVNAYWRGESKSVYTGHGWTSLLLAPEPVPESFGAAEVVQRIRFVKPVSETQPIFSAGTPIGVTSLFIGKQHTKTAAEGLELRYDPGTTAMFFEPSSSEQQMYGYELVARVASVPDERLVQARGEDPEEIVERELQLPVTLPDRVRNLGVELTAGHHNRYESVQSVIQYLKENYTYSLASEVPARGQDFTDYFLFEQRQGYCDHFSTAMTVLLRSGGIPARWVKGFAPGTADPADSQRYSVSYADAHSWVEVYFPEEGWVSFDPTPGYGIGQAVIGAMADTDSSNLANVQWSKLLEQFHQWSGEGKGAVQKILAHLRGHLFLWSGVVLAGGFLLLTILLYGRSGYRHSMYLLWPYFYRRADSFPDRTELLSAADRAWKGLYVRFGGKCQGTTAREYLLSVSMAHAELAPHLERFIAMWETLYYGGGKLDRSTSRDFLDLCRYLAFGKS